MTFIKKAFQPLKASLFFLLTCHTSFAATQMVILEDAKEMDTTDITLPSSDTGTLYFKNCASCNQNPPHINKASKFLIGNAEVDFPAFKKTAEMRSRFLVVFYDPKTHVITRMKL